MADTAVHKQPDKDREKIASMFDGIATRYDFLNHFLSMGTDIIWRKKAISLLKKHSPETILDVATGTGDFAIEAMSLRPKRIVGVDISEGMLAVGRDKIKKKELEDVIALQLGDSTGLPFEEGRFDAVTVAFGVRNFENLEKGLAEMRRVLRKEGIAVILEFSRPSAFPVKQLYAFYFRYILPLIGKLVSRHSSAYTYLPASVRTFPEGQDFLVLMEKSGYRHVGMKKLSFGIASIYYGEK